MLNTNTLKISKKPPWVPIQGSPIY